MANFFKRRVSVRVLSSDGGFEIDTLDPNRNIRVAFNINRRIEGSANVAKITFYNLNEDTRGRLQDQQTVDVVVSAGYEDIFGEIFRGNIYFGRNVKQQTDILTELEVGDAPLGVRTASVSRTFTKQDNLQNVIEFLANESGLGLGNVKQALSGVSLNLKRGLTVDGKAYNILQDIAQRAGFETSIKDGNLQLLKPGETIVPDQFDVVELTAETGLLEAATFSDQAYSGVGRVAPESRKIKARSLLNPRLIEGQDVILRSRFIEGNYKILEINHVGDTRGPDFYSDLTLRLFS